MNLDWCEHAGRLIQAVETQDFAPNLSKALRAIVNFEYTVVFGYVGSAKPLALFNDFSPEREKLHVDEYLEGPYLLDPFFWQVQGQLSRDCGA